MGSEAIKSLRDTVWMHSIIVPWSSVSHLDVFDGEIALVEVDLSSERERVEAEVMRKL